MNFSKRILLSISSLLLAVATNSAYADMSLVSEQSTVNFVSVKKGTIAEAHTINKISGSLSDTGELKISLDLSSVDTKIEIRDQRMKDYLFETSKFATATITASLGKIPTQDGIKQVSGEAKLNLHGVSKVIKVDVSVMKSGNKLMAVSRLPIIIKADDFKLTAGIAKLQELAKLPSIATAVPVSFVLIFNKD